MEKIKAIDDWIDTAQLICTKADGKTKCNFNSFAFPSKFTLKIYRHGLKLQEAEDDQQELKILINKLNNDYNPKNQTKIKEKKDPLKYTKKLLTIRDEIIRTFKKGIFPYIDGFQVEKESGEESTLKSEEIDTTDMPDLELKNLQQKEEINKEKD